MLWLAGLTSWMLLAAGTVDAAQDAPPAVPITEKQDLPAVEREEQSLTPYFDCAGSRDGVRLVGWCKDRSFTGIFHLGWVLRAHVEEDTNALLQASLLTSTERHFRGLFQLGLINHTGRDFTGLAQIGLFNSAGRLFGSGVALVANRAGEVRGPQLALLFNGAREIHGLQLGSVFNQANTLRGAQLHIGAALGLSYLAVQLLQRGRIDTYRDIWSIVGLLVSGSNHTETFDGLQLGGWVNEVERTGRGLQVATVNLAGEFTGLQVGLYNRATLLHGVQLGLVNVAGNGLLPFTVVINAAF